MFHRWETKSGAIVMVSIHMCAISMTHVPRSLDSLHFRSIQTHPLHTFRTMGYKTQQQRHHPDAIGAAIVNTWCNRLHLQVWTSYLY